jgi:predicted lipoprotein with Yx(FWY)xxD motif
MRRVTTARSPQLAGGVLTMAMLLASASSSASGDMAAKAGSAGAREVEDYVHVPTPEGIRIQSTELEGPVFATADGHTLYVWPFKRMRVGYSGEQKGKPACYDQVLKETAGLMSPYPAGAELPELDKRPSCAKLWPPMLAKADDKPVGKWTVVDRKDGTKQWAYDEQPVYTSILDKQPGDVYGGFSRRSGGDSPASRQPIGPPSKVPPGFEVKTTTLGRLLTTKKNFSVYSYDKDTPEKSNCVGECAQVWTPLIAPEAAQPQGDWTLVARSAGVKQWAYRKKPLYTYTLDQRPSSLEGSDVPGWHNVYTQRAPSFPKAFTLQDSIAGQVVADAKGKTLYQYNCGDDSQDQLSCENPDDTQVYRLAMCGAGDPVKCQKNWPYVLADKGATSISRTWTVMSIDPKTGHRAAAGQADALSVWAYRDRPVYTYAEDKAPGDVYGDATGEWRGGRNGLKAIWVRDDFFGGGQ